MKPEIIFRFLFILAFLAMLSIRIYFQSKVLREPRKVDYREGALSLAAGSVAALVTIVFGAEYILSPGTFAFAYWIPLPSWLRWIGAIMLTTGIILLASAHTHLGRSFHSLIVTKQDQTFVDSGPYRWIRHPIYTAYLINYAGGGLLAGNWVLTFVPVLMFGMLVAIRVGREEQVLIDQFGEPYIDYMQRTGRLIPKINTAVSQRE